MNEQLFRLIWLRHGINQILVLLQYSIIPKVLDISFRPLIFTKLRFLHHKKKTTKPPPKFCNCSSFNSPRSIFGKKKITCGTSLRLSRQRRPSQNWPWRPKLPQMQNLGGGFVDCFLGGQNHNFGKVRWLKLLLNLFFTLIYLFVASKLLW